ncbi:hypothetical protein DSECCO2_650960 [anaerobic digester metagenome]
MVAESMEILAPMDQLGCLRAWAGVTVRIFSAGHVRKGPPEAVRMRRTACRPSCPAKAWNRALCSESTGRMTAPDSAHVRRKRSPARTRASLLARHRTLPALAAARAGTRPAAPTWAASTRSASGRVASAAYPSRPTRISGAYPAGSSPRSSRAPSSVRTPRYLGRTMSACRASSSTFLAPARATTRRASGFLATTLRALVPMEPVLPRMARERGPGRPKTGETRGEMYFMASR